MPIYELLRSKAITGFGKLGKVRALSLRASHLSAGDTAARRVLVPPYKRWTTRSPSGAVHRSGQWQWYRKPENIAMS